MVIGYVPPVESTKTGKLDNPEENNNIKQESSKTTRLEKKRNLVIGYVPSVESTKTGKVPEPKDSESTPKKN